MPCKIYDLVIFVMLFVSSCSLMAQDNLSDLPLDELAHVAINKKTVGLLDYEEYNPNDIYLGLMLPYSKHKEYSGELRDAVELAIAEINLMGGVMGRKLNAISADDGAVNELAVVYADSLRRAYHISALIGPSGSARVIHLARTYLPGNPMLIISPSASSNEITGLKDGDLVWRAMPGDAQQAKIAAHYILKILKKKSVGIIYAQDAYGRGLCEEFKRYYAGSILSEVSLSPLIDLESFDFQNKLNALFKNKPEAIFIATASKDAAVLSRKIAKGKYLSDHYAPVFFGADALKERDFIELGDKTVMEGMFGTALISSHSEAFKRKYYREYHRYPTSSDSERAYDIVYILALAMEKAQSTHYPDMRNEIRNVTRKGEKMTPGDFIIAKEKLKASVDIYFEGFSGRMQFDAHGDLAAGEFEIWQIMDGKFITVGIQPFKPAID